jgi:hypothetical protein
MANKENGRVADCELKPLWKGWPAIGCCIALAAVSAFGAETEKRIEPEGKMTIGAY